MIDPSFTQPRRKDRAVNDEAWIKALLQRAPSAVIATDHEGQPFLHTNLFVYDETAQAIYYHTALHGRARSNLEGNERVCLTVSEIGRLLPADAALEFSVEYASVVVFGSARLVDDPGEAARGLQLLLDKYFPHLEPGRDYRPIQSEEVRVTSVFRIDIEAWSGKQKKAADDFPGAFLYGQGPV